MSDALQSATGETTQGRLSIQRRGNQMTFELDTNRDGVVDLRIRAEGDIGQFGYPRGRIVRQQPGHREVNELNDYGYALYNRGVMVMRDGVLSEEEINTTINHLRGLAQSPLPGGRSGR